jgi:sodium bicarbonate cotransporter 4
MVPSRSRLAGRSILRSIEEVIFFFRKYLQLGTVFLDIEGTSLQDILDILLEHMINTNQILFDHRDPIKQLLLQKHRHQFEGLRKTKSEAAFSLISAQHNLEASSTFILNAVRSFSDMRNMSIGSFGDVRRKDSMEAAVLAVPEGSAGLGSGEAGLVRQNEAFLKKIPRDAEAANILVGEVDFLKAPVSALIRLERK